MMNRLRRAVAFVLRTLVFLPLQALLAIIALFELLDWLGLYDMPAALNAETLAAPLGFVGGITPFASWRNVPLLLGMAILSGCLLQPIFDRSLRRQRAANPGADRDAIRAQTGKTLTAVADAAKLLLLAVASYVLIDRPALLNDALRWLTLTALGTTMVIDSRSWSRKRHQYGLSNYFTVAEPYVVRLVGRVTGGERFVAAYVEVAKKKERELDSEETSG